MRMIFNFLVIPILLLMLTSSFSTPETTITVQIAGLRSNNGHVLLSVFDNARDFPKDANKAVQKAKVKPENGVATATFSLPPGKYAAAILHDENDNLKMDFNLVGMPKEGFGFSNDATGTFGPPSFEKASFIVKEVKMILKIKPRYML